MYDSRPEELIHAEKLMYSGKLEETLEIINNFEKIHDLSKKEQLWSLLLRGWISVFQVQFDLAIENGFIAYQMSQDLELVSESIEALTLKSFMVFFEKVKEASKNLSEAQNLLDSNRQKLKNSLPKLEIVLLQAKTWFFFNTGEYIKALDFAKKGLEIGNEENMTLFVAYFLYQFGYIYQNMGEIEKSLSYEMKSLELFKELNNQVGVASILSLIGITYRTKGDLKQAQKFIKQSSAIDKISSATKNINFTVLGTIYKDIGKLNKSLECFNLVEQNIPESSILTAPNNLEMGITYRVVGNYKLASKYLSKALEVFEKKKHSNGMIFSLFYLLLVSIERESPKKTQEYLTRINKLSNETNNKQFLQSCNLARALVLKTSNRRRKLTEAETILRNIIKDEIIESDFYVLSLISLCDLLLEELSMYKNPEVLDEINPVILRLLQIAEQQNSYMWRTEGLVLQAKLALISMDLNMVKTSLTQAQQIAEEHGLKLLAQKISSEHDSILQKVDEWEKLQNENIPMTDRIELASFDGVIDRLKGKRAVNPPKLVDEEPILLLIMDNSGATYFNHSFAANWDHSDLFGTFMSAFNTFSDEIFSKSIDRIRIGDNTILINPVEPFLACYVIKGQSYPALQKLTRFTEAIQEKTAIWQALNKSVKTSEMLSLDKPPELKTVIYEIF